MKEPNAHVDFAFHCHILCLCIVKYNIKNYNKYHTKSIGNSPAILI